VSGLDHLREVAAGIRPSEDGLLGNTRCAWGGSEILSEESILAAFAARPFDLQGEVFAVETPQGAALIGEDRAMVADLYQGRIGRLWRVGSGIAQAPEQAIDVAFDADLRQERGDICFRPEDHPSLDPAIAERLLTAARVLVDQMRKNGTLRVRGFVVRAFGGGERSVALLSLFTLGNGVRRSASFSYAVLGLRGDEAPRIVCDDQVSRDWTPRL